MNAAVIQTQPTSAPVEDVRRAIARLFDTKLRQGYRLVGCHRYNDATGKELFRVVRLKCGGLKDIKPITLECGRYVVKRPARPASGWPLYVPPFPLVVTDPTFIVEGEACADALAKLGLTATTSGGASSADAADWTPLRGRSVTIWPDHDEPGAKYAVDVVRHLRALGCDVRLIDKAIVEALPEAGDVVDWLAQHSDTTADTIRALHTVEAPTTTNPASAPQPLPDPLPDVPAFDADLLPQSLRAWCMDAADGLQCPLDFVAIPAMVALAGALGRSIGIRMKQQDHWVERPVLWGAVIGRPSSGKSPALAPARRMLERLARNEREIFDNELREYQARAMVADAGRANAKQVIQKALKAGDEGAAQRAAEAAHFDDDEPAEPRIVTNDATVEKIGVLLNQNPRGLVLVRDELSGWLASMDREGRESDRAFWLECWNGTGEYITDRIGRGTIRVAATCVSVLGGMQPGKLAEYVRGAVRGGFADDGLMQRFQLAVYPDLPAGWQYTDRAPDPDAEAGAWDAFQRLRNLDSAAIGAESAPWSDVPFIGFDTEAQGLLIEWVTTMMQRLRAGNEPPWMESHLAKFPALAGRLALILHLADGYSGAAKADTLARALNWCEYLEGHARRIYSPAADHGLSGARLILKRRSELGEVFKARDLYRRCWAGLADPNDAQEAIDTLVEYGHLIERSVETGGRPAIEYQWRAA